MKSSEYWKERMSALNGEKYRKSTEYYEDVRKQYRKAIRDMERNVLIWYERIADNNGVSLTNAKKLLNAAELEEFHWTVEEYIQAGERNAVNGQWVKQLENASAKYHISRLEAMRIQLQQQAELIAAQFDRSLSQFLGSVYEEQSYHTAYEIAAGIGIGRRFERINPRMIEQVLAKPWAQDGKVFSERIWTNRDKLIRNLHTILAQGIVRGTAPQRMIVDLSRSMEVSQKQAANLILTETAAISARATQDTYKKLGVEEFEVLETLDSRTCGLCADMDGKHFSQKDYQIGVTVPPFHPRCRGTTVPYFDDEFTEGEMRTARDENDKGYELVPADMTYREWEERFVREGEKTQSGLRSGKIGDTDGSSVIEDVQEINYNSSEQIKQKFSEFVMQHRDSKEEYAGVITTDNKLYFIKGTHFNVGIDLVEDSLKDAIVIHNHPDGRDLFGDCFSKDDFSAFFQYGIKELQVFSGLGRFSMTYSGNYFLKEEAESLYDEALNKIWENAFSSRKRIAYEQLGIMQELDKMIEGLTFKMVED